MRKSGEEEHEPSKWYDWRIASRLLGEADAKVVGKVLKRRGQ